MPDLVNDPRYFGVDQPNMENPLHDDDPSNDWMFDSWKANADLWREWHAKQEDAVGEAVKHGAESGDDSNTTLNKLGFRNQKEMGMSMFSRFGNGGLYATQGAAVDPGWEYNWATGKKFNKGTADKYANGTLGTRWESINPEEMAEYRKAQNYQRQGLTDYGQQANAEAFGRAKQTGHFQLDPRTGMYFSGASAEDPGNVWTDKFGRGKGGKNTTGPTAQPAQPAGMYGTNSSNYGNWNLASITGGNTGWAGGMTTRPELKSDTSNSNYGAWGSTFGKPAVKGSAQQSTLAGESDQYQSPANKTTVPGLNSSGSKLYS